VYFNRSHVAVSSGTYIVSGEADIVFKNCIKIMTNPDSLIEGENVAAQPVISKPFVVPKGQKLVINKPGNKQNLPLVAK
jgi:hypothetical protein